MKDAPARDEKPTSHNRCSWLSKTFRGVRRKGNILLEICLLTKTAKINLEAE
jgi:hypothetical protein